MDPCVCVCVRAGCIAAAVRRASVCALGACVCSLMWLVMQRPAGDGPVREPAG